MQIGYFTPDINWSVRKVDGSWCLVCRGDNDEPATKLDQFQAIEMWKRACDESYDRAAGMSDASNRNL